MCIGISGRSSTVQPFELAIERDKAGLGGEDAVKPLPQLPFVLWCGIATILLDIGIKPPDAMADALHGLALVFGEGVQLVNQSFAVDSAHGV